MPTIYDVAREAGVSPKTVSRVLNADAPVSQKTRRLVELAVRELNYVPSKAAQVMRSNRSGLIGVITGAISNPQGLSAPAGLPDLFIVQGIQNVISSSDRTLLIADSSNQDETIPKLFSTFINHRVEGLIYVAEHMQEITLPELPANLPLTLVNCFSSGDNITSITPDDYAGQKTLVAELIRAGHRRIGYLTLPSALIASKNRMAGYKTALDEAGIAFDPELVGEGETSASDTDSERLASLIRRMLALPSPPTVFCCGNDKLAMRVYGLLRSQGIKVPEDMSVAGYDDYKVISTTLYPSLTTMELPYFQMGQLAARTALQAIDSKQDSPATQNRVAGSLCWRSSVTVF